MALKASDTGVVELAISIRTSRSSKIDIANES